MHVYPANISYHGAAPASRRRTRWRPRRRARSSDHRLLPCGRITGTKPVQPPPSRRGSSVSRNSRERARLLERGVLPHDGRVLHQGRLPPQPPLLLLLLLVAGADALARGAYPSGARRRRPLRGLIRRRQQKSRRLLHLLVGVDGVREKGRGLVARAAPVTPAAAAVLGGGRQGQGAEGALRTVAAAAAGAAEDVGGPLVVQLAPDLVPDGKQERGLE